MHGRWGETVSRGEMGSMVTNSVWYKALEKTLPIRFSRDVRLMAGCQADTIHTINTGGHTTTVPPWPIVPFRSARLPSSSNFFVQGAFRASLTRPKRSGSLLSRQIRASPLSAWFPAWDASLNQLDEASNLDLRETVVRGRVVYNVNRADAFY